MRRIRLVLLVFAIILSSSRLFALDAHDMLRLLKEHRFEKLEQTFAHLRRMMKQDINRESHMIRALGAFQNSSLNLKEDLLAWQRAYPRSAYAKAAYGAYMFHLGTTVRGTRFISKTDKRQLAAMHTYHRQAKEALIEALQHDPLNSAYAVYLLYLYGYSGSRLESLSLLKRSVSANPLSFHLHFSYLMFLQPKWGGSLEAMRRYLDTIKPHIAQNPKLATLEALYTYTQADMLRMQKHFDKAKVKALYDKALRQAPDMAFLHERKGDFYRFYLNDYDTALEEYFAALKLHPHDSDTLTEIAFVYYYTKRYDKAMEYANKALRLDELHPKAWRLKSKLYNRREAFDKAIDAYLRSLVHAPFHARTLTTLGVLYYRGKEYAKAAKFLQEADRIKPISPYYWYYVVASQWHMHDCAFVASAARYQEKCDAHEGKCDKEKLEWAIKSAAYATRRGICPR